MQSDVAEGSIASNPRATAFSGSLSSCGAISAWRRQGHLQADPRPVTCARHQLNGQQQHCPRATCVSHLVASERSQIREMRDLHGPRPTGACFWSLVCPAQPQPCPLACSCKRRHDKMVAALLHRELRVPPWARQRGLLAFGRVRVCRAASVER